MRILMYIILAYMLFPVTIAMTCESVNGSVICSQDISFAVTEDGKIANRSVEMIPLAESDALLTNSSDLSEKEFYSTKSNLMQIIIVLMGISLLALSIYFYVKSTKAQSISE